MFSKALAIIISWYQNHLLCAKQSLNKLLAAPIGSSITISMTALAFAIPLAIFQLSQGSAAALSSMQESKQITLFLADDVNYASAVTLAEQLKQDPDFSSVELIDRQQALNDFAKRSQLEGLIQNLPQNPLPHLLLLMPREQNQSLQQLEQLQQRLEGLNEVAYFQLDTLWLQRLQAWQDLANRSLTIVTALLLLGACLILINVIRWELASRRDEINIMYLVGASDRYIRRPFMYSGFWLGLFSGALALILVLLASALIYSSLGRIDALYGSNLAAKSLLEWETCLIVLGSSALIGLFSASIGANSRLQIR